MSQVSESQPQATPLRAEAVSVAAGDRLLVSDLVLELQQGELVGLLGCNGAGKTTILHTLAGLRAPLRGRIWIDGSPLESLSRREIARHLGLLMQSYEDAFPANALDMALIGRHPHIGFWQWESERDLAIAREALAAVDLAGLEPRWLNTLSGGERRRLAIATVLAQQPEIYLLDEPLNHLDPQHQIRVLGHFRALADAGKTVLASLHDLDLAARYCDRALLLFGDGAWLVGATAEMLTSTHLSQLYRTPIEAVHWRDRLLFVSV